jgi:hypothetical protein
MNSKTFFLRLLACGEALSEFRGTLEESVAVRLSVPGLDALSAGREENAQVSLHGRSPWQRTDFGRQSASRIFQNE